MRRLVPALLLLALSAPAAQAQEVGRSEAPPADVAAIERCVESAGETPSTCVGSISGPCDSALPDPNAEGSHACVERETAAWDAILNERYASELKRAEDLDADLASYPGGNFEPVAESLREARRAWIAFRDAECDRRYAL